MYISVHVHVCLSTTCTDENVLHTCACIAKLVLSHIWAIQMHVVCIIFPNCHVVVLFEVSYLLIVFYPAFITEYLVLFEGFKFHRFVHYLKIHENEVITVQDGMKFQK